MESDDESAVRAVLTAWLTATRDGDADTVLDLIADDAVFLTPGAEPFGKEAFVEAAGSSGGVDIDASGDIEEVQVAGDWAFARTRLVMTVTVGGGAPVRRSGYTLSVLRREPDGRWRLARDANLVTADEL